MVILETLEQHIDTIVTTLTAEEKQQFVMILQHLEQAVAAVEQASKKPADSESAEIRRSLSGQQEESS